MKYRLYLLALLITAPYLLKAQYSNFKVNALTVAIVVSNAENSIHFYKDILGLKEAGSFDIDSTFARRLGLSNQIPFHVDLLQFSDSTESSQLKIVSFTNRKIADSTTTFIEKQLGLQYMTLQVDSLNSIMANIKKAGIISEGETPIKLGDNRFLLLLKDPDGVFVELIGDYKE